MKIKLILSNAAGVVLDHTYGDTAPGVTVLMLPSGWCLDHGDTIKVMSLNRLKEDGALTSEDERVLAKPEPRAASNPDTPVYRPPPRKYPDIPTVSSPPEVRFKPPPRRPVLIVAPKVEPEVLKIQNRTA